MTDADYTDDLALLANASTKAESLLHSLEQAVGGIGVYINANKTEYMRFKQKRAISILRVKPLRLVDKFTHLGSSISSTERSVNICLSKAWSAIDRLSIIWKSHLPVQIKRNFFQAVAESILLYGCTTWMLTKRIEKKLDRNYTNMLNAVSNKLWEQHTTKYQRYGYLPPISQTIQIRRTCAALLKKRRSLMNSCTWMCQCWTISKNLLTSA